MSARDPQKSSALPNRKRDLFTLLHWAGYLTTAGVAAAELLEIPLGPRFAGAAGLLAAFAAALAVIFRTERIREEGVFIGVTLAASVIAIGLMAIGSTPIYGSILFFVICTIVGMRLPIGAAIAWVVAAATALLVCLLISGYKDWLSISLSFGAGFFAFFAFSVAFRRALQARAESQQLLAELTSAQGRLRDLAVMEERQRLAREMHDAVGHRLTAAAVLLEGAGRLIPSEPARAIRMVETSRTQVRQGLDELRAAVSALHDGAPGSQPLGDVIAALVDVYAQGADARVSFDLQPGLPEPEPDRKTVIIRTAQEALTNVRKHAAATQVELTLISRDDTYVLTCRDNGRGMAGARAAGAVAAGADAAEADTAERAGSAAEPGATGYGLGNLRARAAAFGGRVDLERVPNGGTLLRLTLPAGGARDA
jgi:signal transduction histidine kinase